MTMRRVSASSRYGQLLAYIFVRKYEEGAECIPFTRAEIEEAARDLGIERPKNLGDVIYSFRYRTALPEIIAAKAPPGKVWVIRPAGRSRYVFDAVDEAMATITPNVLLAETKVPNATPGVIAMYALSDEQALLAILRYNRLVDIFTGVTCYSLQSHLRTTVRGIGQIETDEIYVGVDKRGAHFVVPVQAKGGTDTINIVQIEQDIALCAEKFKGAICRPVAAQFMAPDLVALFEFAPTPEGIRVVAERHYRLVAHDDLTTEEVAAYATRGE